ncbi:MAG: RsmE family RNA methyltransferase, partial [Sciscionella sp.]
SALCELVAEVLRAGGGALVLHESAELGLATATLPEHGELVLVVGPEGGIDEAELAELVAAGARAVRMGPIVLRASTAAAVALGAIGARSARWRDGVPQA